MTALLPHLRTIAPRFWHALRPLAPPPSVPWSTTWADERFGTIQLSGQLSVVPGAAELVLLVHGLGGSATSHYMVTAALHLYGQRCSILRLNLRGSDLAGEGFYHAALSSDLDAALSSCELVPYRRLYVLGLSLGGHLALWQAIRTSDDRLRAVAAVCSPLDLAASSRAIDAPPVWLYRRYILRSLRRIYEPVATRREVPIPVAAAARIRLLRDWDERIVAPFHGFAGADDYYARASVAPHLGELRRPALLINTAADPMVPEASVRPALRGPLPLLEVRYVDGGGHVALPRELDLGFGAAPGLVPQALSWFRRS